MSITTITDGVLNAVLKDGEILEEGKVNWLLNKSNYLAFQAERRNTVSVLLKLEQLRENERKKSKRGRLKAEKLFSLVE